MNTNIMSSYLEYIHDLTRSKTIALAHCWHQYWVL